MEFVLDTNIWIHLIRNTEKFLTEANKLNLFSDETSLYLSIVSAGELYTIAGRNKWGKQKLDHLALIFEEVRIVPISRMDIVKKYAEIDLYSQGIHPTISLPSGMSARNMGKNDIWIAATTSILSATLLTMDKDFDHLKEVFIDLQTISVTSD